MLGKRWAALAVGAGLSVGAASTGLGQGLYAPAPGADLERLSRRMAEAVRELGNDIVANMGQTPAGQYLARDAQELHRAADEWYASLRGGGDPYQVRRSYSGIDSSWHRLRAQLAAPGVASPAVAEEIARVEQADAQIHQALQLNAYPAGFEAPPASPAPPTGQNDVSRLAYALAQRGEALAATIQADYGPNAGSLLNDSAEVARMADSFHDALSNPGAPQQPDDVRLNFAQIVQKSNSLGLQLGSSPMPPRVRSAWDAYTSVHNLLRSQLGLTASTPNGLPDPNQGAAFNPNFVGGVPYVSSQAQTAPVAQWADQLDRQVDELLANFGPTANVVPEGGEMLQEIERLRNDVRNFRGDAGQGLDPNRLAYEFREVDADWQRLARRFNRIGQGRTGPNIQRVQQIGQTCQQIHQVLGMPGYPPTIGPFDGIR